MRAAVLSSLGTFIGGSEHDEVRAGVELNIGFCCCQSKIHLYLTGLTIIVVLADASPLVRKELVIAMSRLIAVYRTQFAAVASGQV